MYVYKDMVHALDVSRQAPANTESLNEVLQTRYGHTALNITI